VSKDFAIANPVKMHNAIQTFEGKVTSCLPHFRGTVLSVCTERKLLFSSDMFLR